MIHESLYIEIRHLSLGEHDNKPWCWRIMGITDDGYASYANKCGMEKHYHDAATQAFIAAVQITNKMKADE